MLGKVSTSGLIVGVGAALILFTVVNVAAPLDVKRPTVWSSKLAVQTTVPLASLITKLSM
ncbi:hypothetical protein D3C81_2181410 [compost metagenome]